MIMRLGNLVIASIVNFPKWVLISNNKHPLFIKNLKKKKAPELEGGSVMKSAMKTIIRFLFSDQR